VAAKTGEDVALKSALSLPRLRFFIFYRIHVDGIHRAFQFAVEAGHAILPIPNFGLLRLSIQVNHIHGADEVALSATGAQFRADGFDHDSFLSVTSNHAAGIGIFPREVPRSDNRPLSFYSGRSISAISRPVRENPPSYDRPSIPVLRAKTLETAPWWRPCFPSLSVG